VIARPTVPYPAQRPFHSARARSYLKRGLLKRLRSLLKSLVPEACTAANFCKLRIRRNRSMARSRRLNNTLHRNPQIRACSRITA